MTGTLPHRNVLADVLTSSYRIVGKIPVYHSGMIGLLNDTTTSIMEVREANMARLDKPTKLVDRLKLIRVVKERVFAVSLSRPDDIGPTAWARGGFGQQRDYQIRLVSPVFEMDGLFRWSERFDLHAIMVEGTRDFLPLFDVVLKTYLWPDQQLESPAMLFNRKHVEALALLEATTGELAEM